MKICSKCQIKKPYTSFNKNKTRIDGYNYWCKKCLKPLIDKHYQNNKLQKNNIRKARRLNLQLIINKFKSLLGCQHCKESDYLCLQFHHIDNLDKESNISLLVKQNSRTKLIEEINK